jgi:lysozyme
MLSEPQWALIFGAAKKRGARWPDLADVDAFKREVEGAFDIQAPAEGTRETRTPSGRQVSQRGIDLMHQFEGCVLKAYKDPGSKDGLPITIGFGSTSDLDGNPIKLGTVWTKEQACAKFAQDLQKFAAQVDKLIGSAPTDQSQFDACVALAYNVGVGAFAKSTVLRKHKAGDHAGAAAAFGMWVKNDGVTMRGLVRRRAAEAALYLADG